jgi:Uma2 family endonuclease
MTGQLTASTSHLLTAEEFSRLPGDGCHRYELVKGKVVKEPPPGIEHGDLALRLGRFLQQYVDEHRLGLVTVESGFVLERGPDTVRGPDVAFVSTARLPPPQARRGYGAMAPDLVVEVVSPSDRASKVEAKAREYLAAGSRLVCVVGPPTRSVAVYRPDGSSRLLRESDPLDGEDVLPGFRRRVAHTFAP